MADTEYGNAGSMGGGMGSRTGGRVQDFMSGMQETAQSVKDRATEFKEQYVDQAWGQTCDYIRKNPAKSVLISAAVGLVLGSLLRRR